MERYATTEVQLTVCEFNKPTKPATSQPDKPTKPATSQPDVKVEASVENVSENLRLCSEWISIERQIATVLMNSKLGRPLINLEDSLFEMAYLPLCTDGVFYLSMFEVANVLYVRYIEGGFYRGFFAMLRSALTDIFAKSQVVWWEVFPQSDISSERMKKEEEADK